MLEVFSDEENQKIIEHSNVVLLVTKSDEARDESCEALLLHTFRTPKRLRSCSSFCFCGCSQTCSIFPMWRVTPSDAEFLLPEGRPFWHCRGTWMGELATQIRVAYLKHFGYFNSNGNELHLKDRRRYLRESSLCGNHNCECLGDARRG